jgi:ATP-dependent Zn protease
MGSAQSLHRGLMQGEKISRPEAIRRLVEIGAEGESPMTVEERRSTAIHEAGHVVVGARLADGIAADRLPWR